MGSWLGSIRERRLFFMILGLVLLALILVRYVATGQVNAANVIDNLIAASTVSFVALMFYRYIPREFPDLRFVSQIDPSLANEAHTLALGATTWWSAHGHTAKWVRTEVAPRLEQKGQSRVRCIIINPGNPQLCQSYVDFRNRHRLVHHDVWTVERLQAELVSTVLAGAIYTKTASPLTFDVFLADSFSPIRFDISETLGVLTTIDPRDPPLVFSRNSAWYQIVMGQIDAAMYSARALDFRAVAFDVTKRPTTQAVAELLSSLHVPHLPIVVIESAIARWNTADKKYW